MHKNIGVILHSNGGGELFRFTCYPNGLACAPRNFTKITKVLFSSLRKEGFVSTNYIDDCLLLAQDRNTCKLNVRKTVDISLKAGFTIHPEKSILEPTTRIIYLGFILDSVEMSVRLTPEKALKLKKEVKKLRKANKTSIRYLAKVIGLMVSSFPGTSFGKLFYRKCDNLKIKALKLKHGNYEAKTSITAECRQDLIWWENNILIEKRFIVAKKPDIVLETDASKLGWGACLVNKVEKERTGGNWSSEEANLHINILELKAAIFAVFAFCKEMKNKVIKIYSDNTTTVTYLNNMGGTKEDLNDLTRQLWLWCLDNKNFIICSHLPGVNNGDADKESRTKHDNMEWELNKNTFNELCERWGTPDIDCFANRLNHKLPYYYSWKPDPGAKAIDAMKEHWGGVFSYIFPPFNLIGRALKKLEEDGGKAIIIVPEWNTQTWYPKLLNMCIDPPLHIFRRGEPVVAHPHKLNSELPRTRFLAALVAARTLSH